MTPFLIYKYFRTIKPANSINYCQRCTMLIGKKYINKKVYKWSGFYLCERCYKDKLSGKRAKNIDLEDLTKEYKQKLINCYELASYVN